MTNIFGKFSPKNSIINKIDCRLKLLALILLMIVTFLDYGNYMNNFLFLGLILIISLVLMLLSKTSLISCLKSLKNLWFVILFLTIVNCLIPYGDATHVLFVFKNGFTIYWEAILNSIRVAVRLIIMIFFTMIYTSSTSPLEITSSFDWYFTPLKIFKVPTQVISMTMSLALRFIPTLLEEADRIMKAQKSRGVDFQKGILKQKIKSVSTLIVPLLISCFSKSDELAIAMDARGYDPYAKRSNYREKKFNSLDLFAFLIVVVIFGLFLTASVFATKQNIDFLNLFFNIEGTF